MDIHYFVMSKNQQQQRTKQEEKKLNKLECCTVLREKSNSQRMYSNSREIPYLSWNSGFMSFLIFDLLSFCLKDKNFPLTPLETFFVYHLSIQQPPPATDKHAHTHFVLCFVSLHSILLVEQYFHIFSLYSLPVASLLAGLFTAVLFSSHENISQNVRVCCFPHGCRRHSMWTFLYDDILIILESDSFLTWPDAHEGAVEIYWDQRRGDAGTRGCRHR